MTTIKAAIRRKYCTPSQIKVEEIAKPTPQENELLIKVFVTTVNRTDCANLTAKPFIMRFVLGFLKPRQIVLGTDFSGEVVAKGNAVKAFDIGDKVFSFIDTGVASQAEYMVVSEQNVF